MTTSPTVPPTAEPPSPWVAHFLADIAPGGRVLDVACGAGRHVRLALGHELAVTAIDRDTARLGSLAGHPDLEVITADLENGAPLPIAGRSFDAVIVTNYLWRPILPALCAALAPHGLLMYETFAAGHAHLGGRPSNPDFLLRPNELAEAAIAAGLHIIAFEHVREEQPRPRIIQRLAAVGAAHTWAEAPPGRFAPQVSA